MGLPPMEQKQRKFLYCFDDCLGIPWAGISRLGSVVLPQFSNNLGRDLDDQSKVQDDTILIVASVLGFIVVNPECKLR